MNPQESKVIDDDQSSSGYQPLVGDQPGVGTTVVEDVPEVNATNQPNYIAPSVVPVEEDQVELAWVDKAKAIIHNYSEDPYKMTVELEKLRIDYMQKQHGKTIKSNEDRDS